MVDVEVRFVGGAADGQVRASRGEDGAPPRAWTLANGDLWDVYAYDPATSTPTVWAYVYESTETAEDAAAAAKAIEDRLAGGGA